MMVGGNAKVLLASSIKSTAQCAKYAGTCNPSASAVIGRSPMWHLFQEGVGGHLKISLRAFH